MSSISWDMISKYEQQFDRLFTVRGFTHTVNSLALWPITVFAGLGLALNLVSIVVNRMLIREFPAIGIYRFLRVYLINSALACFVLMTNFVGFSIRVFPWIMTEQALKYYIHFFLVVTNVCSFYSTVLNILITIERIWTLRGGVQLFNTNKVTLVCGLALLAVLFINTPLYLYSGSMSRVLVLYSTDQNGTVTGNVSFLWWSGRFTSFSGSQAGRIITTCLDVFRDGFLLLVEIIVNIVSVYYLRVYLKRKNAISFSLRPLTSTTQSVEQFSPLSERFKRKNTRAQVNLTLMVISICSLSIIEHLVVILTLQFPYSSSYTPGVFNLMLCIVALVRAVKHGSNFLTLVIFNSKFRKHFYRRVYI